MEEQKNEGQPELTEQEQEEVEWRSAPRTEVVYEAVREEGENELGRSSATLAWDGLAAGLSMGFSLVAEGLLRSHLPDAGWRPLVAKLGYSVGFLIIVLGRHQLFTENTLTAVLPFLQRKSASALAQVLRLWPVGVAAGARGVLRAARATGFLRDRARGSGELVGADVLEGHLRRLAHRDDGVDA